MPIPLAGVPVRLDRDEARATAASELADPRYDADPSLLSRVVEFILGRLVELVDRAAGLSPGGWVGLLVLGAVVVVALAAWVRRLRPDPRTDTSYRPVLEGETRSPEQLRAAANAAMAAGDHGTSVLEGFRAVAAELGRRGLLDLRPGRTADEVAVEAADALPALAGDLAGAARTFDAVRYGGRQPTRSEAAAVLDLMGAVPTARVAVP